MDFATELVEREPRRLLGLEAIVHVGLSIRRAGENGGQATHHHSQDQVHGQHPDHREARLSVEAARHGVAWLHFPLASAVTRAPRATASLRKPRPHWDWTRRSTL